jgi:hypothetical protein
MDCACDYVELVVPDSLQEGSLSHGGGMGCYQPLAKREKKREKNSRWQNTTLIS